MAMHDFTVKETISKGSFGTVLKVVRKGAASDCVDHPANRHQGAPQSRERQPTGPPPNHTLACIDTVHSWCAPASPTSRVESCCTRRLRAAHAASAAVSS